MRKALLVLAVAAVFAGTLASTAAASHSWGGYHWARTAKPFTIKLGDNVSSAWDSYLGTAAADWSADTAKNPLNATVVAGGAGGRCNATSGRVEVCAGFYGKNGWLGLAQIWVTATGHINRGTAKMNDTYYTTPAYDTPAWRGAVVCQEVGHTFGLDHQDTSGADFHTCMDYADNPDTDNMHPNRHDYQQLSTIYSSHLDASSTIGLSAKTKAERPKIVSVERINRSVRVHRYADGSKRFTFIAWAR